MIENKGLNNVSSEQLQYQIIKMKKICITSIYYCNGELLRILNSKYVIPLLSRITLDKKIKLENSLIFKKKIISWKELFLKNLDYYIGYVRNTFLINYAELPFIIEYSLNNKYADILLSTEDINEKFNRNKYYFYFRRMFLYNLYANIKYYSRFDKNIKRLYNDIKKFNFNDENDIIKIESILKKLINNKNNYDCKPFMNRDEMNDMSLSYMKMQLQTLIEDYYENFKNK